MNYGNQLYKTASPGRLKKLDSITGAFRASPVESLCVEVNEPPLELKKNELSLRFLYKLRSNITYTESLNTLDDRDDQNL